MGTTLWHVKPWNCFHDSEPGLHFGRGMLYWLTAGLHQASAVRVSAIDREPSGGTCTPVRQLGAVAAAERTCREAPESPAAAVAAVDRAAVAAAAAADDRYHLAGAGAPAHSYSQTAVSIDLHQTGEGRTATHSGINTAISQSSWLAHSNLLPALN